MYPHEAEALMGTESGDKTFNVGHLPKLILVLQRSVHQRFQKFQEVRR